MFQLPNQRAKDRPTARKLSTFIKRIFIELDRDPTLYPEGNTAEVNMAYFLQMNTTNEYIA
jgi:hypothetical protein